MSLTYVWAFLLPVLLSVLSCASGIPSVEDLKPADVAAERRAAVALLEGKMGVKYVAGVGDTEFYETTDGAKIRYVHRPPIDQTRPGEVVDSMTAFADSVLFQGDKTLPDGKVSGRSLLALERRPAKETYFRTGRLVALSCWSDAEQTHFAYASTLRHALAFETIATTRPEVLRAAREKPGEPQS